MGSRESWCEVLWRWSSLAQRATGGEHWLQAGPVPLPANWAELVRQPQTEPELAALRNSLQRGAPFGSAHWTKLAAHRLGLESTLRPRGRPANLKK